MLIVAGLSVKNFEPRVWDPSSQFHLPGLAAVMVSYAEFHQLRARRRAAMQRGLRDYLGIPDGMKVYLDNGAFYFGTRGLAAPFEEYEEFVAAAKPDWKPVPRDYIPFPQMTPQQRRGCFDRTMSVNRNYGHDGYVPVVHIGRHLADYTAGVNADAALAKKPALALGGIVPNLLRKPKAIPYADVLAGLCHARRTFAGKSLHVFGVGGTATLHLTSLLGFDSADSSGWRNRAARGIVQLRGSGERLVAELGKWRGREPSAAEWQALGRCRCPACRRFGTAGLRANKLHGFRCRATHNLWILLEEGRWLGKHVPAATYARNYRKRVDNSIYRPLIKELLGLLRSNEVEGQRGRPFTQ
jgi:7-cyano-7-deazaguanine tRNA-ribosyltransferase